MSSIKRYSEVMFIQDFRDRFEYLKLCGRVCEETFGSKRYLNQILYKSPEWKEFRRRVIIRDNGFDLGHPDFPIVGPIYIHHLNPITMEDILERRSCLFDMENVISASYQTHEAIHYGKDIQVRGSFSVRCKNDTCPWR